MGSAAASGPSTTCARCRIVDELMQRLIDASNRRSSMKRLISGELGGGYVLGRKADTLNICFNVLLLHCWFVAHSFASCNVSLKMCVTILMTLKVA